MRIFCLPFPALPRERLHSDFRLSPSLIVLALAMTGTGCTMVGPDFTEPAAPVAGGYVNVDNGVATRPQLPAQQLTDWWTVFNDPTLNRLIDTAYSQNLTLVSAGTKVLEARAELGVATGNFFPQQQNLFGAINYDRLSKADVLTTSNAPSGGFWRAALGAELAWELDFWGKFRRGIESADAAYLASIANYDDVLVTLLANVATTYIGIRTVEQQIDLAKANITRQQKALSIAQDRFTHGQTSRLDVYQAQNVLAATQARVPQLTIQLAEGVNVLRVLLGLAPQSLDAMLAPSKGIPAAPANVSVGIPADLLRRRPDIRSAELRAASQSAQIGVAKADLFPSLTLVGTVGYISTNVNQSSLSDLFTHKSLAYGVGPSLNWNILNYGQITNNVRAQDARFQSLIADYQNTVLKAQQEVEDGIATFVLSQRQAAFLRNSVTAASGALDLAFTQYQEGLTDFTTVLTSEQALLDAQNNLAVALGATSVGLAQTYRALGGGWEMRAGKEFVPPGVTDQMKSRTNWGDLLSISAPAAGQQEKAPPPPKPFPTSAPDW